MTVNANQGREKVLVVDDDSMMTNLYQTVLSGNYEVYAASSGEQALQLFKQHKPDLVLLDIEMPEMSGYEVCAKIRETSDVPVIFATAHQSLDEHLSAYNVGGNDIVTKPIDIQILQRKVALSIKNHNGFLQLAKAKEKLELNFFSSLGESGIHLNFMRAGLACRSYAALAEKLLDTLREFTLECAIRIRGGKEVMFYATYGEPTSLEISILEQSLNKGREFRYKNRLVINYELVSIMVNNMPDDAERASQVRDNMITLTETAEALIEAVEMRQESNSRAEKMQLVMGNAVSAIQNLKGKNKQIMMDSCVLLQNLVQDVEACYSWLDTSKEQEVAISNTMNDSAKKVLDVLAKGNETEQDLEKILQVMQGDQDSSVDDMLF